MTDNSTKDYNTYVRSNLPSGMSYVNNRYVYNGKPFVTYSKAEWYRDYLNKLSFTPLYLFESGEGGLWLDFTSNT